MDEFMTDIIANPVKSFAGVGVIVALVYKIWRVLVSNGRDDTIHSEIDAFRTGLEHELSELRSKVAELTNELCEQKAARVKLESEVSALMAKNTELTRRNSELSDAVRRVLSKRFECTTEKCPLAIAANLIFDKGGDSNDEQK